MTTAAETFSLDTIFSAPVNGITYAIVSDGQNSFVVPAAALEQDVDDDGEDAYTEWCEAARVSAIGAPRSAMSCILLCRRLESK